MKNLNFKRIAPAPMPENLILVKAPEGNEIVNVTSPVLIQQLKAKYECVDLNRIKMLDHLLGLYDSAELGQVKIREEHLPWNGFCSFATYHFEEV